MYTPDLVKLIERHGLSPNLFADSTQVFGRCLPKGMSDLAALISACSGDILSWMRSNRLQLNADKTDLIWCATSRRLHRLQPTLIRVGSETISPSSTIRNLGVYIDSDLSMQYTCTRRSRAVLLHSDRYAVFVGLCQPPRWRPWSCRSY